MNVNCTPLLLSSPLPSTAPPPAFAIPMQTPPPASVGTRRSAACFEQAGRRSYMIWVRDSRCKVHMSFVNLDYGLALGSEPVAAAWVGDPVGVVVQAGLWELDELLISSRKLFRHVKISYSIILSIISLAISSLARKPLLLVTLWEKNCVPICLFLIGACIILSCG
ncbi:hypothetical protein Vadar_018181 [Vaccinium darrowii]|uniref:Uncharacterized protein n=1 Tax=Vaccinium darrowii TaxID=229202 RepID=A0ACB7Y1C7_9ERIC|nr:hypothetical protein Vadar_018181 [Vaccinium darrowii]